MLKISKKFDRVNLWVCVLLPPISRCLKITEKVSFNIVSEASYVYILSAQKLIKTAKYGPFWRDFDNLKLAVKQCYQTCQFLFDKNWQENAEIQKFKWDILGDFQTLCWRRKKSHLISFNVWLSLLRTQLLMLLLRRRSCGL